MAGGGLQENLGWFVFGMCPVHRVGEGLTIGVNGDNFAHHNFGQGLRPVKRAAPPAAFKAAGLTTTRLTTTKLALGRAFATVLEVFFRRFFGPFLVVSFAIPSTEPVEGRGVIVVNTSLSHVSRHLGYLLPQD